MRAYRYKIAPLIPIPKTSVQGAHRATIEWGDTTLEIFCGTRDQRFALLIAGDRRLLARGTTTTLIADITRVRGAQLPRDVVETLEEMMALLPDGGES
ncbi:MAG: hypothetical protein H6713_40575 [Myxococcales bacterium]|nr:hypothetical protein [Myxococcales bacterium]